MISSSYCKISQTISYFSEKFNSAVGSFCYKISALKCQCGQLLNAIKEVALKIIFKQTTEAEAIKFEKSSITLTKSNDNLNELECDLLGIPRTSPSPGQRILTPRFERDEDSSDEKDVETLKKIENSTIQISGLLLKNAHDESSMASTYNTIKPAYLLIQEIKKSPKKWNICLHLIDKIDKELVILIPFLKSLKKEQSFSLVKEMIERLKRKKNYLEDYLCFDVKEHYKPNRGILYNVDSLFNSIESQIKIGEKPIFYRKLASNYIKDNPSCFEKRIKDSISQKEAQEKILQYAKEKGGRPELFDKLETKLKRKPNKLDFYCECLEESILWGGENELIALSEQLEVQMLIFTKLDSLSWKFNATRHRKFNLETVVQGDKVMQDFELESLTIGGEHSQKVKAPPIVSDYGSKDCVNLSPSTAVSRFKDKGPILLFFDGSTHYQNLIPTKCQGAAGT